ncbi:hypothetical protein MRX96_058849 [Rhipicephalus microplus]
MSLPLQPIVPSKHLPRFSLSLPFSREAATPHEKLRTPLPDFNEVPHMAVQKHSCARRTGHPLKPLAEGQVTRIRGKNWATKAKVVSMTRPRSHHVVTEDGNVFRRNRQHLLATTEFFHPSAEDLADENTDAPIEQAPPLVPRSEEPQVPRRSTRDRAHRRLGYDDNFVQIP